MRDFEDLRSELRRIDGRSYPAYKDLRGSWAAPGFELLIDHVQGDPFAAPSRVRVRVARARAGFVQGEFATASRSRFVRDLLLRRFGDALAAESGHHGSGRSGELRVVEVGQEVLERTAVLVDEEVIEVRFRAGLPAGGRRILGRAAWSMLGEALPRAVDAALLHSSLDAAELSSWIAGADDSEALRAAIADRGLVAFIADGAMLPRRSGIDDRPLPDGVPFVAPDSLAETIELPGRSVRGLAIRPGVTVLVGGGYHGKSTVLRAIERGVWDHIPGDGRELVASDRGALKIRAEDGRSVRGVDISPFIGSLPQGRGTTCFDTDDASGSTSQAAAIVEALEAGATALLLDEDTSATNFLIRDHRMQRLVSRDREPITPLLDRVRELAELGVSTVLVVGGSGDWFDVADTVIGLDAFVPWDATEQAGTIAREQPTGRQVEVRGALSLPGPRRPLPESLDPSAGRRDRRIKVLGRRGLLYGQQELDLVGLEQLVEEAQVRSIGAALEWLRLGPLDGQASVTELLDAWDAAVAERGLAGLHDRPDGDLAAIRRLELAGALSRLRSLRTAC